MPEPRKTADGAHAANVQEARSFLALAATATDKDGKTFDPDAPAPGEYKLAMRPKLNFAGNREATVKLLNAAFAPATFAW